MDAIRGSPEGGFGWWAKGRDIALDIARGLEFLHAHRVVHCDLKSKNIMLTGVRGEESYEPGPPACDCSQICSSPSCVGLCFPCSASCAVLRSNQSMYK